MIPVAVMFGAFALSVTLIFACIAGLRAWRRRDDRRTPLYGKKLANLPGQQLVGRINDHGDELLLSAVGMYFSLPIMVMAWALVKVRWEAVSFGGTEVLFLLAGLALFAWNLRAYTRHRDKRSKARDGLVAEQMTGQLLNRLIGPNCIVAHDLPCDGFNIDHVVITPHAVYAVETKSFRKKRSSPDDSHYKVTFDGEALRFPGWTDRNPVTQARAQAQWLARYLRDSLSRDIPVVPAIALPGWWIEKTDAGKQSDVRVFTPMGKGAEILLFGQETLEAPIRALIAQAIALRYPDIAD